MPSNTKEYYQNYKKKLSKIIKCKYCKIDLCIYSKTKHDKSDKHKLKKQLYKIKKYSK